MKVVTGLIVHTVEDFPRGYPRFTRLFVAHPSFAISRKFLAMRARLLLVKQDQLLLLEERLDEIDNAESMKLFLGNLRRDRNENRKNVLKTMDEALKDYGKDSRYYKNDFQLSSLSIKITTCPDLGSLLMLAPPSDMIS